MRNLRYENNKAVSFCSECVRNCRYIVSRILPSVLAKTYDMVTPNIPVFFRQNFHLNLLRCSCFLS